MAIVYRVENQDGQGLWHGYGASHLGWSSSPSPKHPSIYHDPLMPKGWPLSWRDMRFAFTSIAQLMQWVDNPSDWRQLDRWGYVVNVYDAPDAFLGATQAVFDRSTASKVRTIHLPSLGAPDGQLELNLTKEAA